MIFNPELMDDESREILFYFWNCFEFLLEEKDIDREKAAQAFFGAGLIKFAEVRGVSIKPERIQEFYNGMVERTQANKKNLN